MIHLINPEEFRAGRVSQFLENWKQITRNPVVLGWIRGIKLDFDHVPEGNEGSIPKLKVHDSVVDVEIEKLLTIGAIEPVPFLHG